MVINASFVMAADPLPPFEALGYRSFISVSHLCTSILSYTDESRGLSRRQASWGRQRGPPPQSMVSSRLTACDHITNHQIKTHLLSQRQAHQHSRFLRCPDIPSYRDLSPLAPRSHQFCQEDFGSSLSMVGADSSIVSRWSVLAVDGWNDADRRRQSTMPHTSCRAQP